MNKLRELAELHVLEKSLVNKVDLNKIEDRLVFARCCWVRLRLRLPVLLGVHQLKATNDPRFPAEELGKSKMVVMKVLTSEKCRILL